MTGKVYYFVFTLCLVSSVSLAQTEEDNISNNEIDVIKTMLSSPLRRKQTAEETILEEVEEDNTVKVDFEDQPSNIQIKDEFEDLSFPNIISSLFWNITGTDNETGRSEQSGDIEVSAIITDSFSKVSNLLKDCNKKIYSRLEKLKKSGQTDESDIEEFKTYASMMQQCIKVKTFKTIDVALDNDTISVTDDIVFMRDTKRSFGTSPVFFVPSSMNGRVKTSEDGSNITSVKEAFNSYANNILRNDWSHLIMERIGKLFETHTMRFNFNKEVEGRGRRRHQMFQMMVMGFMIMATILIPMGFQFLTVLGGKSLLMAKMALIMSAINGLKKIATSNIDYGLYHSDFQHDHHHHHPHGFHDKVFQIKTNEPIEI